jgi:hypothetical protein
MEAIAAQGRERGFVSSRDLLQGLSVEDLGPEQVESFLMDVQEYLRQEGIEVLEIRREASEDEVGKTRGIPQGRDEVFVNDPVRLYLKEIGKVRLLTAAQEVDLAMRMEAGDFAAEVLASIDSSNGIDEERFRLVVRSVVRIREHQLDPKRKLRHEGIGLEKVTRAYRPKNRAEAVQFLRRVEADGHFARKRLIEATLGCAAGDPQRPGGIRVTLAPRRPDLPPRPVRPTRGAWPVARLRAAPCGPRGSAGAASLASSDPFEVEARLSLARVF